MKLCKKCEHRLHRRTDTSFLAIRYHAAIRNNTRSRVVKSKKEIKVQDERFRDRRDVREEWSEEGCWSVLLNFTSPLLRLGFPGGSDGKESTCNVGDWGLMPGLGRSPGEGNDYLLHSGLENSMDRKAWQATVHRVTKSRTQLSKFHPRSGLATHSRLWSVGGWSRCAPRHKF